MKNKLIYFFSLILVLILFNTYFNSKFPYTNDGENHLARFANYKIAIKEAQIPPRFAPNLMNRYGYPVFNFNYPLANIFSLPFSVLKINYELSFKIISIFFTFLGCLGTVKMLQKISNSIWVHYTGIGFFSTQIYLINIILFRGSIGELMAICLLPWVIWGFHKIIESKRIEILPITFWTMYLLSHNVTVFISLPFLIIYVLLLLNRNFKSQLFKISLHSIWAFSLSLWFWIPALFEASFTVVSSASVANQIMNHFPTFTQLFSGPIGFGFSNLGPIDSLSFQLGITTILTIFLSIILIIKNYKEIYKQKTFLFLLLSSLIIIFLQLKQSHFFWEIFPFLKIIQFPWRLSILFSVIIPLLIVYLAKYISKSIKKSYLLILMMTLLMILNLKPIDYFHRNIIDYDFYTQSTSTQNENRSKNFTYLDIGDWKPEPKIIGLGFSKTLIWNGSYRKYELNLEKDSVIIEPTMNFPGWETQVTDNLRKKSKIKYAFNDFSQGRIVYELKAGNYFVETKFTQNTLPRLVGNSLSFISLVGFLTYFILNLKSKKYEINFR